MPFSEKEVRTELWMWPVYELSTSAIAVDGIDDDRKVRVTPGHRRPVLGGTRYRSWAPTKRLAASFSCPATASSTPRFWSHHTTSSSTSAATNPARASRTFVDRVLEATFVPEHHGLVEGNHGDVLARIAERLTSVRKVVERDPSIAGLGPEHAQVVVADARVRGVGRPW